MPETGTNQTHHPRSANQNLATEEKVSQLRTDAAESRLQGLRRTVRTARPRRICANFASATRPTGGPMRNSTASSFASGIDIRRRTCWSSFRAARDFAVVFRDVVIDRRPRVTLEQRFIVEVQLIALRRVVGGPPAPQVLLVGVLEVVDGYVRAGGVRDRGWPGPGRGASLRWWWLGRRFVRRCARTPRRPSVRNLPDS